MYFLVTNRHFLSRCLIYTGFLTVRYDLIAVFTSGDLKRKFTPALHSYTTFDLKHFFLLQKSSIRRYVHARSISVISTEKLDTNSARRRNNNVTRGLLKEYQTVYKKKKKIFKKSSDYFQSLQYLSTIRETARLVVTIFSPSIDQNMFSSPRAAASLFSSHPLCCPETAAFRRHFEPRGK